MTANHIIFSGLCLLFLGFSFSIYRFTPETAGDHADGSGGEGLLVWQKYNCQSCHQIYGLGGYLGPDLTNVASEKGKGDAYILGMLRAGAKQMPAFQMSETEEIQLLEFLRAADKSGSGDPRLFSAQANGMIRRR